MTAQPIPHDWPMIANALGVDMPSYVNPLELGMPFTLTDRQRCYLEPYFQTAGLDGCVIVQFTRSAHDNFITARPLAMTAKQRKSIRASLTRIRNQQDS